MNGNTSYRCPECGAELGPHDTKCWLCHAALTPGALAAQATAPPSAEPAAVSGSSTIVFIVVAVLLGLLTLALVIEAPGLGIILAVVLTPALVRTAVTASRRGAREARDPGRMVLTFFGTIGMVIVVGVAAIVTFYITCFAVCAGAMVVTQGAKSPGSENGILIVSIGSGVIAGLVVAILIMRRYWRRTS